MAGRGADEGRRKLPGSGRAQPSRPRPEVTAPGTEKPRWSAEWRARFAKRADAARRRLMVAPLGAPFPRACPREKGKSAEAARRRRKGRRHTRRRSNNRSEE